MLNRPQRLVTDSRLYCTSHTYKMLLQRERRPLMGVIDVYTGAHVCVGGVREKSTAGVTLISGAILSSSPQGHVAEVECLA